MSRDVLHTAEVKDLGRRLAHHRRSQKWTHPRASAPYRYAPGLRLEPPVYGGGQERGLRAGTENVALAVALGDPAHLAQTEFDAGGRPDPHPAGPVVPPTR